MTAEILIANHQGIVLAADSAVTVGRDQVWKHANKIFSAGPHNDIGVMIYNTGDFLGLPWEVVIKEHRKRCGSRRFAKVNDYCDSLIHFLRYDVVDLKGMEENSIHMIILEFIHSIKDEIDYSKRSQLCAAIIALLTEHVDDFAGQSKLEGVPSEADFNRTFADAISELAQDVFGFKLNREARTILVSTLFLHVSSKSESAFSTGLVIAGFGEDEFFPTVVTYVIDGRWKGLLRFWVDPGRSADLNKGEMERGMIMPFAQSDMANLFLDGLYPKYLDFVRSLLKEVLDEKSRSLISDYIADADERKVELVRQEKENLDILSQVGSEFKDFRQETFINPLMKTVDALPKEEMVLIARSIIDLTALRRKFASPIESVGGAIDVGVISKSDGFIWIERKHYFDIDYNSDFLNRKNINREKGDETLQQSRQAPAGNTAPAPAASERARTRPYRSRSRGVPADHRNDASGKEQSESA